MYAVGYLIALAVLLAAVLTFSFAFDRRDRRHGRQAHVHMKNWFDRRAQVRRGESLAGVRRDAGELGIDYSPDALRVDDRPGPHAD